MELQKLLDELVACAVDSFGKALTGVYLHGSLAMGCFNEKKSDIDLLYVIDSDISDGAKFKFMDRIIELNEFAPEKGIEMSVVKGEFLKPFVYPTPFELHFSCSHIDWYKRDRMDYIAKMQGTDPDLAAHAMITNHYGKTLYGKEIPEVFGPVACEVYLDSIRRDIEGAAEDILRDPVYIILNLCRVLAYIKEELCLSKEQGGLWGAENIPECHRALVKGALKAYKTGGSYSLDKGEAVNFASYMLGEIL